MVRVLIRWAGAKRLRFACSDEVRWSRAGTSADEGVRSVLAVVRGAAAKRNDESEVRLCGMVAD